MTTIIREEVNCGLCDHPQTVHEIGSTNSFGAMDLDTRPPGDAELEFFERARAQGEHAMKSVSGGDE